MLDLKIVNGRVVTPQGVYDWGIGVKDGKIAAIGESAGLPEAGEVIDASGKVVLAGGVDTHVHAGDPGFPYGFDTATKTAAMGGVTTVVDMPVQFPLTVNGAAFDTKMEAIAPKAYVDFALWGTAMPNDLAAIDELAERGVVGFKFYVQGSVGELTPRTDDGVLVEAMEKVAGLGMVLGVHAESQEIIAHLENRLKEEGRNDPWAFIECHPPISELEGINRALYLGDYYGVKLHIFHCSIAPGVDMVHEARLAGQPVSVETCPHYLFLTENALKEHGNYAKISPALRDEENIEDMWKALRDGKLDNVASDHVAFTHDFKRDKTIWEAAAGAPGIQTMYPLLLAEGVNRGRITLPQLAKVMSEGAARMTGLYPRKGSIAVGADADFAIFDLEKETEVKLEDQIQVDFCLYEGLKAVYADKTVVRGKVVYDGSDFPAGAGYGEFTKPS